MKGATVRTREVIAPSSAGASLLVFADPAGVPRGWRLLSGGAVVGRGDEIAELPEQREWVRVVLAVPGADVTVHWLELDEGLTAAQAAAAARLQIAEEAAEPIADMHVAAGRVERGLRAIAVVPAARMTGWIESARGLGMDPDLILPSPMLLPPPGEGLVCWRGGEVPDYRGTGQAFSVEDELAALILGDVRVTDVTDELREAGFGPALADPAVNLRQGAFQKRRQIVFERSRIRWLTILALTLLVVSLAIETVVIIRTNAAAKRVEAEAQQLRAAAGGPGQQARPAARYGVVAGALFEAVREVPNVEVTQIAYQSDGSLRASVLADTQASIDALRARVEARGMQAAGGLPANLGGRAAGEIIVRPR